MQMSEQIDSKIPRRGWFLLSQKFQAANSIRRLYEHLLRKGIGVIAQTSTAPYRTRPD